MRVTVSSRMSEESALERFSRKGRRVTFVLLAVLVLVAGGGVAIALEVGPLEAVAYVVALTALAGFLFPRLV